LAASSGRDLDAWRAAWLDTGGTDRLTLEPDGDGLVLAGRDPRPQVLAVGAYRREPDNPALERIRLVEVEVQGPRTPVRLPPADLYLINDEDLTFATSRPDDGSRDALLAAAGHLPAAISRGVAVATAWDLLVTGEATAAEVVRCLTGVLAVETSDSVIEPYLNLAADIAELWASDADRPGLVAEVAAASAALATDPDRRQVALRTLARTAGDVDALAALTADAGDDVDLRWRVLVRKSELGGETAAEARRLLAEDQDPDAGLRALAVRAAAPDPGEKAEIWRLLTGRAVPIGAFGRVAAAFWRPGQDDLLAPYAEKFVELLPGLHRGGMILAMSYSSRLFPLFGIDEKFLDQAESAATQAAPVVHKTVLERADEVRRMLRSRS
ncbi:MAG: ERAP1-like C-terminal domain-containing protein, partial [Catenulispora sp.]